ncbi:DUF6940 family protein [endosymbiont GvMRE of Glomus versiforme]|uniref:DUF6940 family protein n=1 Tax=endosymbiont GvMRE of Glomus versiforme TaxID=2039283 RepID=UPI000EBA7FAE|nr:hypothetical protein [endosymbiont GvMRE of Glomus versiforme]RHZ36563.1 hypothetical protein GvMRE_I2g185 [endosymbiont GvMRE of Glomus versiforme]
MKFSITTINNNTIKYQFTKSDNSKLTQKDFINLLKEGGQEITEALKHANSQLKSAYFWECPPITKNTLNKPFECVVIKSKSLDGITPNHSPFQKHINDKKNSFTSNSGNILIIPLPEKNENNEELDYKNLTSFIQNVPDTSEQKQTFWQEVAHQLEANLESNNPRWLSTHGLGISWLHVRIDKQPIYYSWNEYKQFTEDDNKDSQNDKDGKLPDDNKDSQNDKDGKLPIPNNNQPPVNQDKKPNLPTEENPSFSNNNSDSPTPTGYNSKKLKPDKKDEKPNFENDSTNQKIQEVKQTNSDSSQPTNSNSLLWIVGISGGVLVAIGLGIFFWLRKKK